MPMTDEEFGVSEYRRGHADGVLDGLIAAMRFVQDQAAFEKYIQAVRLGDEGRRGERGAA